MAKKTEQGTPPLAINATDWKKVGKGALIALSGALITILVEVIPGIDFGKWTPIVAATSAVIVNLLRVVVTDTTK